MQRSSSYEQAAEMAQHCLGSHARKLERVLTRIYDGALRDQGVTSAQLGLLVAIELAGPTTAAWLGSRLSLEKSTVSRNLARLEAAGLVDASNGVRTTSRGSARIRACHPLWRRAQKEAEARLGAKRVQLLSESSSFGPAQAGIRRSAEKTKEPK